MLLSGGGPGCSAAASTQHGSNVTPFPSRFAALDGRASIAPANVAGALALAARFEKVAGAAARPRGDSDCFVVRTGRTLWLRGGEQGPTRGADRSRLRARFG